MKSSSGILRKTGFNSPSSMRSPPIRASSASAISPSTCICTFRRTIPLAGKSFVTLEEIAKYRIIVHRYTGFWLTICQQYIPESNLLIQGIHGRH